MREDAAGLLAEQIAYYRAVASEYWKHALVAAGGAELERALDYFTPSGDVLELACGCGAWTPVLLRHARTVTAVDAAPEMLAAAAANVRDPRVRFLHADVFDWRPDRRWDVVFFGFWLSHVPPERFGSFWSLVDRCLGEGGRVFFVDDGHRSSEELIDGECSDVIERRLLDGSSYRIIKVALEPRDLENRLALLGWKIAVTSTAGPFFWGAGGRA